MTASEWTKRRRRASSSRSSRPRRPAGAPASVCPRSTASSGRPAARSTVESERGKGAAFKVYLPAVVRRIEVIRKPVVLITGAGGEIGHGLIAHLAARGKSALDHARRQSARSDAREWCSREFTGRSWTQPLLERILSEFEVDLVFHLAALLSTRSEFTPVTAHQVNVEGTLNLLEFAQQRSRVARPPREFLYPSSIAAYGLPDLETKTRAGHVREDDFNAPTTMYGATSCIASNWATTTRGTTSSWPPRRSRGRVDFRCVRFPG